MSQIHLGKNSVNISSLGKFFDKSHLIKTYEFIQRKLKDGSEFQYLISINEEGTLTENFGDADIVDTKKLRKRQFLFLLQIKNY